MSLQTPQQAKEMVDSIVEEFYKAAREKTVDISDKERWVIIARAVNSIFAHIYGPSMTLASREIFKGQVELMKENRVEDEELHS